MLIRTYTESDLDAVRRPPGCAKKKPLSFRGARVPQATRNLLFVCAEGKQIPRRLNSGSLGMTAFYLGRCLLTMLIREYTESDLDALRRMHARQGFDYAFPNLADPIFVSKLVVEDDAGRAVMASLARLTCEMYLLADAGGRESARTLRAAPRIASRRRTRSPRARPRRRARLAPAAHREPLRPPPRGARLGPRRRLDALLPPPSRSIITSRRSTVS